MLYSLEVEMSGFDVYQGDDMTAAAGLIESVLRDAGLARGCGVVFEIGKLHQYETKVKFIARREQLKLIARHFAAMEACDDDDQRAVYQYYMEQVRDRVFVV